MWHSEDKILGIFKHFEENKAEKFPKTCPICNHSSAHLFFYRFKNDDDKGGLWIWCSDCKACIHTSCKTPNWWVNMDNIKLDNLTNSPDYLNKNKNEIDKWINKLY